MTARLAYWGMAMLGWFCIPAVLAGAAEPTARLKIAWANNTLSIESPDPARPLPGGKLTVNYLEAYCRPGSQTRDWGETVIKHATRLVSASADGHALRLECRLADGVVVEHAITAGADEIDFQLTARNPTTSASQAHWAQPCIRVAAFTGRQQDDYLSKCFVFIDGRVSHLPTQPWATKARYTPGQVYRAPDVEAADVNPRPLSSIVPSHGLIGCESADGAWLLASAWEPYQELFQGVITCVHSDFRIGGLAPDETKQIRGKIYLLCADQPPGSPPSASQEFFDALLDRYQRDFSRPRPARDR